MEVDATFQRERAVKFDFHTARRIVRTSTASFEIVRASAWPRSMTLTARTSRRFARESATKTVPKLPLPSCHPTCAQINQSTAAVQRKRVRTVRTAARPAVGASCFNAPHPDHEVALDGLEPEVVRGMRREKFEPTQAVVDGRAADGPRQLRGHRCRTRGPFQ